MTGLRAAALAIPLWVLAAVCADVAAVLADTAAAALYQEGNDAYRRGDFAAARQRYLAATEAGVEDARLFYNLGNACFKADRLGEAVVWYERALRLSPRDADVLANLRFLRRVKRDREDDGDGSLVYGLYRWPTLSELFAVVSAGLVGLFGVASWRLVRGGGTMSVAALVLCGGTAVFGALFATSRLHDRWTRVEAVVTAPEGRARSGPDRSQTSVFVIHEGTKLNVERREGDWALVRLANGLGGWLPVDVITEI